MAKLIVTDELWERVEPLLPEHPPRPKGGRPPVDDRVCLTGILFVLKTGIQWEDFPQEMGCCGMTLWNRLRDWQAAGVWHELHVLLLAELRGAEMIDFAKAPLVPGPPRALEARRRERLTFPIAHPPAMDEQKVVVAPFLGQFGKRGTNRGRGGRQGP